MTVVLWMRALRLPFLTVSVLPYVFGTVIAPDSGDWYAFLLGLLVVAATHLSANLANDAGDAVSGADARDPAYYGFFGGAKLIQEGVLTVRGTAAAASVLAAIALVAGVGALFWTGRPSLLLLLAAGLVLGGGYTLPPLKLGYRRLGELSVLFLFGPACVAGGAAMQGAALAAPRIWVLSLPFGCLAASVLAANEVPDAETDALSAKQTLVTAVGAARGYTVYLAHVAAAVTVVLVSIAAGFLSWVGLGVLVVIPLALHAAAILHRHHGDKRALLASSRAAVAVHAVAGIFLVLAGML